MTDGAPSTPRKWPGGVTVYIACVNATAVVAVAVSWAVVGPPDDGVGLTTLLLLGLLSIVLREPDVGSRVFLSFLSIIVISSTVLVGPVGGAVVGALPMALQRGHRSAKVRIFNTGMVALQGTVGGLVYLTTGGVTSRALGSIQGADALLVRVGLPLMAADVAQMLVNALLLSGVVRLSTGVPPKRFLVQIISNSGIAYIGYGVIGFLLVILWVPADVGPFSAVLILAPLMAARWAFVQYGDEQRAQERALSALVTAVETKDPFATGHSARIAQLAEWMAAPLAMGAQEAQALRFSAMLHDVGKIGVPTRVLRARIRPTEENLEVLIRHPQHGVELVRQIDFLAQSLDGIRHHHERWDGRGYPHGLARDAIPLASRVIAVADAFDALTTSRPDRPALTTEQALAEMEAREGAQFDPWVVKALRTALERHTWAPASMPESEITARRGYIDHDDPVVWEQVWTMPVLAGPKPAHPPDCATPQQAGAPAAEGPLQPGRPRRLPLTNGGPP